jgi:Ser/Thr protein kinase RdoA (MazF antagonist)
MMRFILLLTILFSTRETLHAEGKHKNMDKIDLSTDISQLKRIFDPSQKKSFCLLEILKVNPFENIKVVVGKILFGSKIYVLKEIPPYCASIPFLEAALYFREKLRNKGLPIPSYLLTSNQKKYAVLTCKDAQQKIYLLEKFIDGQAWNYASSQIIAMSFTLAKLHNISSALIIKAKENSKDSQSTLSALPKKNVFDIALRLTTVALEVLKKKNTLSSEELQAVHTFIQQCQWRLSLIKRSAILKGYEEILIPIHGDYNPTNIIFNDKNEVAGLIDFDDCCFDNPIHDILTAVLCMCYFTFENHAPLRLDKQKTDITLRKAQLFLDIYFKNSFFKEKQTEPYLEEAVEALAIQSLALYLIKGLYTDYININQLLFHVDQAKNLVKKAFSRKKVIFSKTEHALSLLHLPSN